MIPLSEFFRSVEHIWLIWAGSAALLAWLTWLGLKSVRWGDWKNLLTREEGAAYSLSYVLTFPFFLLLVCLVIETTLFLVVKIGTVYAAYAAARANIVWRTTPGSVGAINNPSALRHLALVKSTQAAINAMAAFSSSSSLHLKGAGIAGPASADAKTFYKAYSKYAPQKQASRGHILAKYLYATKATSVSVMPENAGATDDITATVSFDRPFIIPGIGRILGERAPWSGAKFYTYKITSQVSLQNEAPKNGQSSLGIGYVSNPVYSDLYP